MEEHITSEIEAAIDAVCDESENFGRNMPSDMHAARARLVAAIVAVVLAEREACARVAEWAPRMAEHDGSPDSVGKAAAGSIRARGAP